MARAKTKAKPKTKAKAKAKPKSKSKSKPKASAADDPSNVTTSSLAALERAITEAARGGVQPTSTVGFELDTDWLGGDVSFELVVDGVAVDLPAVVDAWSAYLAQRDQIVTACQAAYDELEAKNPTAEALVNGKPWKPIVRENERFRATLGNVLAALKAEKRVAAVSKIQPVAG